MRKKERAVEGIEQATTDEPFPQVPASPASALQRHEDPSDPIGVQSFLPRYGGEGCDNHLMAEIVINGEIFDAYTEMTKAIPERVEPALLLSWYLHELAQGFGVFESLDNEDDPVERVHCPEWAQPLLEHCLATDGNPIQSDRLRNVLYQAILAVAGNRSLRQFINRRTAPTETGVLMMAQVYWNLEADETRTRLPIPTGESFIAGDGQTRAAGLKVPNKDADYALMPWTKRIGTPATWPGGKTSGGGFRTQGARLLVLIAQHIITQGRLPLPELNGPELVVITEGSKVSAAITWTDRPHKIDQVPVSAGGSELSEQSSTGAHGAALSVPVRVGTFAELGENYQQRGFDTQIEALWADGGDRRIWLRGAPGQGKTFSARRIMQDAITQHGDDPVQLLIWVDTADAKAVVGALAEAAENLPSTMLNLPMTPPIWRHENPDRQTAAPGEHLSDLELLPSGSRTGEDVRQSVSAKARALLEELRISSWRWVVVLDNADAEQLIEQQLIPTGMNPNGRVLITTTSPAHRMRGEGRVVEAELFTQDEALAYLEKQLPRTSGTSRSALASAVGYHPLALSIASSTIEVHAMEIEEWLEEFTSSDSMDHAADEGDRGGYPHGLSATWRLALAKASKGLPEGLVERAALVAAIQDPDGHPTWLWEYDEVTDWVASGSRLERRHGRPVVLHRLIEYGVLELRGDTWRQGRIAMHQLAGRAVIEGATVEDISEISGIVARAWLARFADEDLMNGASGYLRNLRVTSQILDSIGADDITVSALMQFGLSSWIGPDPREYMHSLHSELFDRMRNDFELLWAIREHLTSWRKLDLAVLATAVGHAQHQRGARAEAQKYFGYALEAARSALETSGIGTLRARCLAQVREGLTLLGRFEEAGAITDQLLEERFRVLETRPGTDEAHEHLSALAYHYREQGDTQRSMELQHDIRELLLHALEPGTGGGENEKVDKWSRFSWLKWLRECQLEVGEGEAATATLKQLRELAKNELTLEEVREVDLEYISTVLLPTNKTAAESLLVEHVNAEWRHEEPKYLDDLVRLASLHLHNGRMSDATRWLTEAVRIYRGKLATVSESATQDLGQESNEPVMNTLRRWVRMESSVRGVEAIPLLEKIVTLLREKSESHPGRYEHALGGHLTKLGKLLLDANQEAEALNAFADATAIWETLVALAPADIELKNLLLQTQNHFGEALIALERHDEAIQYLEKAVRGIEAPVETEYGSATYRMTQASTYNLIGRAHVATGRIDDAADAWHQNEALLLEVRNGMLSSFVELMMEPISPGKMLLLMLLQHSMEYQQRDRLGLSEDCAVRGLSLASKLEYLDNVASYRSDFYMLLARIENLRGNDAESVRRFEDAVREAREALAVDPENWKNNQQLSFLLLMLGLAQGNVGETEECIDSLERATSISLIMLAMSKVGELPVVLTQFQGLEEAWRAVGRDDEADEAARQAELITSQLHEIGPEG